MLDTVLVIGKKLTIWDEISLSKRLKKLSTQCNKKLNRRSKSLQSKIVFSCL